ncbi:MAG: DUF302 domain-containing protein [Thermodesulfobacteriota bacterium]|nr:MAG: DUF302 domain-containing protein [Thermodesulfobacteriota bacterium]
MSGYAISKVLDCGYEEAIERVKAALSSEGFGVLTEIDVKAVLKKKLDKDFAKYIILGACNPNLAYRALTSETEIGLFLPCNVIVYENDRGETVVSAVDATVAMSMIDNPVLAAVAKEVKEKLEKVINSIA